MDDLKPRAEKASFVIVIVLVTIAFVWLLIPFYGALLWAVILALLFNPLERWLTWKLSGRRGFAAALSVLACICIVLIPGVIVLSSLTSQATGLYERIRSSQTDPALIIQTMRDSLPAFVTDLLERFNLGTLDEIQQQLASFIGQTSQFIASRLVTIGQGTAQLVVSLGVMLYVLFFLFRDGRSLALKIGRASPLSPHHTAHILNKFSSVVKATVKGNVIIAGIQGTIGGIAFYFLGLPAALLWGVSMAILSLLPAVGAAIVWGPVAVYLILSGAYLKGAILIAIGVLVIGLVDNLLRPPLVGAGTRMPDYVVLVSTLGGIALFGINGFVVGPLIAALFIAVWSLFTEDRGTTRVASTVAIKEETTEPPQTL
ncbi:AI-2E family transporter [Tianweitania sp. BSSL-BM11]|uniref:AI-2E family transporter n=1 Tax=Tianweitania aestuarii TaxID=2814886 RepID=A0ABS5RPY1_9HYPH|nr:AI-2E family transporter [Tianweitania aestuarii]MBS9719085.1 AI-2E family transporter [Tianweitania aestuarii]